MNGRTHTTWQRAPWEKALADAKGNRSHTARLLGDFGAVSAIRCFGAIHRSRACVALKGVDSNLHYFWLRTWRKFRERLPFAATSKQ